MINNLRSFKSVPHAVMLLLVASLSLQLVWHHQLPAPETQIESLIPPPSLELLRVFSLGDTVVSSKLLMLWLQGFDTQTGKFLSYRQLNYTFLQQWLERILSLDPRADYPLLAASHLYSTVPDSTKQRQMLQFVYEQFFNDPIHRWQWLAHAALLAKHRLKDLPLALKYAQAIAKHANPNMPHWAQDMQVFMLEDMGELEQARLIIGGMLASGQITDRNEIKFLNEKLADLQQNAEKQEELLKK